MARGRRWSGPVPVDEERCTRNDGKKWRCYVPRHPDSIYCHQHHVAYIAKCKGASFCRRPRPNPPIPKPKNPVGRPSKNPTTAAAFRVSRTPAELELGQIWAFSQAPDPKIPRHYARIDRKLPSQSSVLATPLIPHPVLEEEMHWTDAGNRIMSCGTFRASPKKPMAVMDASAFAFQVVSFKTVRWMGIPFYRIFPNKGEVWAVSGKQGGECKLVEVLSDFSEEEGVTVAGLVPVEGRGDGVYGRHLHEGFRLVQTYERREMVMFSHRVPAERAEGVEGDNQLWKVVSN